MSGAAHEIELKLRLPAGAAAELLRHPALAALQRAPARRAMLRSVYFDTPDRQLARAGVAVRLRKSGRDWLQTVKGPATAESAGGLAQRVECEWRLSRTAGRPPLDLAKLANTPYRRTIEEATRHATLVPLFGTDFARTTIALGFSDSTTAQLCLDQGAVHAGERVAGGAASDSISELELELGTGNPARLFELAATLSADLAIAVETRSKAERGYALVAPQRAAPIRAAPIALPDDASAADAMAAILRNCLRQIEFNADGVRVDDDPEWIHQMRVGVRRLRSALALMRQALPISIAPLDDELSWLADVLGRARDLDVFLGETMPAIAQVTASAPEHAATIDTLTDRTRAQATAARDEVRAAVASVRFTRIELATGWLAAGLGEGSPGGADLAAPARSFAVERLARRHRKLERAGAQLADGSPDERHQARIAAKKMRYAAEFFEPLFDNKRARAFRRACARLQEELGAFNDASVAATLASDLCGSASRAAALAAGWAAARVDARDKKLARAWRGFTKAGPFWTGD